MSKKSTTTGVAVNGQFTQSDIPNLLEIINNKIAALKGDKEKATRITGGLGAFGKISDITDINTLRGAYAYVTKKYEAIGGFDSVFKTAAPTITLPVYKEGGASLKQWQDEIVMQFKEVSFKEELDKLEKAKQILQDNLSTEMKLAASLNDIAELMKA